MRLAGVRREHLNPRWFAIEEPFSGFCAWHRACSDPSRQRAQAARKETEMKENAIGSRRHAGHMLCLWTGVSLCACGPAVEGQDEAVFAAEPALSGTLLGSGKPVAVPAPGAGGVSPKAPPKGGSGGSSGTGAGSAPAAFLGTLPEVGFTPSHRAVLLDTATYTSPCRGTGPRSGRTARSR
jgi:hypothetical protein